MPIIEMASTKHLWGLFFSRNASPISGVRIAAPMGLAQRKGHERISEVRKAIRSALPIVSKIAY
jgi:hypothetical protein